MRKRLLKWVVLFLVWSAIGLAFSSQLYLSRAQIGDPVSWKFALGHSLADWYVFAVLSLPAALLVGVAFLASGCHPAITDPKDPKFIVAEKGNWKITRADLDAEMGDYLKQHQMTVEQIGPAKMPMFETAMLDNMVLKKIFLEKAARFQCDLAATGANLALPDRDESVEKFRRIYPPKAQRNFWMYFNRMLDRVEAMQGIGIVSV